MTVAVMLPRYSDCIVWQPIRRTEHDEEAATMAAGETPVTDGPTPPYAATVSAEWTASAAHPVAGRAGEHLVATARVEDWRETPGWAWRWCRDSQGREGWAPEALLMVTGDGS